MAQDVIARPPNHGSYFQFWSLPLEVRRLIYDFADLRAPYVLRSDHVLEYVEGKKTTIAPLLAAHPDIQAEAFAAVIQQNVIDLTELVYVFPLLEGYVKETQADMDLFRSIRNARIDCKNAFELPEDSETQFTALILDLVGRCVHLERLELYFDLKISDAPISWPIRTGFTEVLQAKSQLREVVVCWSMRNLFSDMSMNRYALLLDQLAAIKNYLSRTLESSSPSITVDMKCDRILLDE